MSNQTKKPQNRMREELNVNPDDWQHYAARGVDQMRDMVSDNAGRSMLIALGAGLGVGFLIGTALSGSSRSSGWWDRSTAEGLGKGLLNRLEQLVPESINDRFKS